jgi:transposase
LYCFAVSLCIEREEYGKSYFSCEPDAQKEIEKFSKNFRYCKLVNSGIVKEEIPRQGRKPKVPVPVEEKLYRYKIELEIGINQQYCDMVRRNRSFFVVATNDVERGFRFLKDPEFFADSIFVSKNEYIQALLMIMTFGLAVFSGLESKLRNPMKESNVQLPNQTGKLTDKITMRYVFQIFSTVITIVLNNGERLFYHISEQANIIQELLGDKLKGFKNIRTICIYGHLPICKNFFHKFDKLECFHISELLVINV